MSLKKFFLYLYLGVFVVALIATAYLYVKQKNMPVTPVDQAPQNRVVDNGPLYVYSANGDQGPLLVPTDNALSVDGATGNALLSEQKTYTLEYFADGKTFNITLLDKNLRQARLDAEKDLLDRFQITQEQACSLSVNVGTVIGVSQEFSGRSLGLSFCSNRVDLPTEVTDGLAPGSSGGQSPDVSL